MKPLNNLNNVERAKLLHELFPDEIPAILEYVKSLSVTIEEEREMLNSKWDNQLFSFAFWLSLVKDAEKKIDQYGVKLHKSSRTLIYRNFFLRQGTSRYFSRLVCFLIKGFNNFYKL